MTFGIAFITIFWLNGDTPSKFVVNKDTLAWITSEIDEPFMKFNYLTNHIIEGHSQEIPTPRAAIVSTACIRGIDVYHLTTHVLEVDDGKRRIKCIKSD